MTNSAFATSIPTNAGAVDGMVEPPGHGRRVVARSCVMRDASRATVRALKGRRATPTLTLGLADRRAVARHRPLPAYFTHAGLGRGRYKIVSSRPRSSHRHRGTAVSFL